MSHQKKQNHYTSEFKESAVKLAILYERFALDEVVAEALGAVEAEAQVKGLELTTNLPTDIVMHSDRKRLLQCLLNFLSNAIKYSEHGSVRIETQIVDGQIELTVSDTGIGIQEPDLDQLFQPFLRLGSPLKMHTTGTGLGLYLTRKLARDVLGGDVSVRSLVAEGSAFSLRIPERMPPERDDKERETNNGG